MIDINIILPILDIQVKVENNKIIYKFYKKPVSSPLLMLERSAMPMNIKRNTLAEEGLWRLRNTKRDLAWEIKADILSEFSFSMMLSSYSEKVRCEIIQSVLTGYEHQCDRADRGITPLHRPQDYNREERRKRKLLAMSTWYWPKDAVGFFPGTPGGELAKSILEIVTEETERLGLTAKIVETGGMSLRNWLVRSDLTGCLIPSPLCLYCESGAGGGSHTRGGVVYMGQCLACRDNNIKATYHGQSGFSAAKRGEEHKSGIDKADLSNSFAKHLHVHHPERERDSSTFEFKVVRNFKKPLNRQVFEGVRINQLDTLMNSKSEFHQPAATRVTTVREVRSRGT